MNAFDADAIDYQAIITKCRQERHRRDYRRVVRTLLQRGLVRDVGFNPVDMGPLSVARYIEPFSLWLRNLPTTVPMPPHRFEQA